MDTPNPDEEVEPVIPDEFVEEPRLYASMENWGPRLQEVAPTPKTEWVELQPDKINEGTKHEMYFADWDNSEVREAIEAVGGPPAFIRTDQASAKHKFDEAAIIEGLNEKEINSTVGSLISDNTSKGIVGLPFSSLVVREKLDISHELVAWNGLRVGAEARFRISDNEVMDWVFYWEEGAVEQGLRRVEDVPSDWKEQLETTRKEVEKNLDEALLIVQRVAEEFDGFWTVDTALTTEGEWYCIDMAPAKMSHYNEEVAVKID